MIFSHFTTKNKSFHQIVYWKIYFQIFSIQKQRKVFLKWTYFDMLSDFQGRFRVFFEKKKIIGMTAETRIKAQKRPKRHCFCVWTSKILNAQHKKTQNTRHVCATHQLCEKGTKTSWNEICWMFRQKFVNRKVRLETPPLNPCNFLYFY